MKRLLLYVLLLAGAAAEAQFPITVSGGTVNSMTRNRRNESKELVSPIQVSTGLNAFINLFDGAVTGGTWLTTPVATTVATGRLTAIPYTSTMLFPDPARKQVVRQIFVYATLDCSIYIQKSYNYFTTTNLYGATAPPNNTSILAPYMRVQNNPAGGYVTFDFPADDPLIVRSGERVQFFYLRSSGTQQPNFGVSITGRDFTNDDNEGANIVGLFLGDSKMWITPDGAQSQANFPHFMLKDSLSAYKLNNRVVNIAVGGSTIADWDFWVNQQGRIDGIPFSYVVINPGTNDATLGAAYLSAGAVDGAFKTGYKNVLRKLHGINPRAPVFVLNIQPTDLTSRQGSLANYRTEIGQVVTWAQSLGWPVYLVDVSTIFPTTDKTYFVSTEQAANGSTHESSKGLLADFNALWSVVKANMGKILPITFN